MPYLLDANVFIQAKGSVGGGIWDQK